MKPESYVTLYNQVERLSSEEVTKILLNIYNENPVLLQNNNNLVEKLLALEESLFPMATSALLNLASQRVLPYVNDKNIGLVIILIVLYIFVYIYFCF
jgi:hypothetical protein